MLAALQRLVELVIPQQPERNRRSSAQATRPVSPSPPVAKVVPAVPRKSTNPRRFTGTEGIGAWRLQVPDPARACEFALANQGRRFAAAATTPLPAPDCCRGDCACMYQALPEERQGPRRVHAERRVEVRFDTKKVDRRKNSGRRIEDVWDRKRV